MRTIMVLILAMFVTACVTAKQVPLPDGQTGYVIDDCDDMAQCYKKAAEVCGGKYEMLDKSDKTVGSISGAGGVVTGFAIPQHSITIRCAPPQERVAK